MPIICLIGRSGSGKTTLEQGLVASDKSINKLLTNTTREPREGEEEGVHYHFRTIDEFKELYRSGRLIEHERYADNYYGVSIPVDTKHKRYVLAIDPEGYRNLKSRMEESLVLGIFLDIAPHRVISRLGDRANLLDRLNHDHDRFNPLGQKFDLVIDANQTVEEVLAEALDFLDDVL